MSPEILRLTKKHTQKEPETTLQIHFIKWHLYFRIPKNLLLELFYIKD
jgi:hypothetical protein